jgi:FAD/FMN-containing dehydrogenase
MECAMGMVSAGRLGRLSDELDGRVLLPGDADYDRARAVWNAMVDRRPRLIARCVSAGDVATAVRFAREHDLEVAVRCGGHSVLGLCVPDGGIMIDLTPMGRAGVDREHGRAWVQGGALLGALDRATQVYGLATTAGNVSHTGVGGLTLGGGMGWLARQYGLSCDNVSAFELITAEGNLVRASNTDNPELYWGLRGGGGNFGIVTKFEFRLHPVGTEALVAEFYFLPEDAPAVMREWRDLSATAPRQATFTAWSGQSGASFLPPDLQDKPLANVGLVWVGDPDDSRSLVESVHALGRPVAQRIKAMSYLALQTIDDDVEGHTLRRYWKGHYLGDLTDEAIQAFVERGTTDERADYRPAVSLQSYGGAIAEVPDDDTAFSQRATQFEFVAAARWSDPEEDDVRMSAARACAASLDPFAIGAYVNVLSDEGAAGVRRAYSPRKLARLTALKDAYDPDNVLHLNQNIKPSGRPRPT